MYISLNDGTNDNTIVLYFKNNDRIGGAMYINGSITNTIISYSENLSNVNKVAYKWSSSKCSLYVNGSLIGEVASPTLIPSSTLNDLSFSNGNGVDQIFNGEVSELVLSKTALTDTQLADLTTL
jgi:hypothetical protein